jgi:[ribosomal protein S18]-alanine N-acetyltransferase
MAAMMGGSGTHSDGNQGIIIRAFRPDDSEIIEAILRESPEAAQWTPDSTLHFGDSRSGVRVSSLLAESEGEIVAFIVFRHVADEAEILNLAVLPGARRSGFATALLEEAVKQLRAGGAATLFLEVRESNYAAIKFYQANGFATSGHRPSYYREPDEAGLCMMREFTALRD